MLQALLPALGTNLGGYLRIALQMPTVMHRHPRERVTGDYEFSYRLRAGGHRCVAHRHDLKAHPQAGFAGPAARKRFGDEIFIGVRNRDMFMKFMLLGRSGRRE